MGRSRWFRVRVETDSGAYLGCLRLHGGRPSLRHVLDDGRAYLALWDATCEVSRDRRGFLVIHKSAIHHVALLDPTTAPADSGEGA